MPTMRCLSGLRALLSTAAILCVFSVQRPASAGFVETFVLTIGGQSNWPTYGPHPEVTSFFNWSGTSIPTIGLGPAGIGGGFKHQMSATGPLNDAISLTTPTITTGFGSGVFTGSASANAYYGKVGAEAHGSFTGATDSNTVLNSEAFGMFSDSFTFLHPTVSGAGFVQMSFTIDGNLSVASLGSPSSGQVQTLVNFQQGSGPILTMFSAGAGGGSAGFVVAPFGGTSNFSTTSTSVFGSGQFNTSFMPITFGNPFDFTLGLLSWAGPRTRNAADVDFLSSAQLTGISVFNSSGPLTGFSIESGSGTFYDENGVHLNAVPEPSTLLLLATGSLAILGIRVRRRRGVERIASPSPAV